MTCFRYCCSSSCFSHKFVKFVYEPYVEQAYQLEKEPCASISSRKLTLPSQVVQEKTAEEEALLDKARTNRPLVAQYERRQMFRRRLEEEF